MESSTRHYIATELRAELGRQRKTRAEFGRVVGRVHGKATISRQAVAAKTRGAVEITPEELVALAEWLDVPVGQFFPRPVKAAAS